MLDETAVCHYIEAILRIPVFCLNDSNDLLDDGRHHDDSVLAHLKMLSEKDLEILRSRPVSLHHMDLDRFWGGVSSPGRLYLIGPAGFDMFRHGGKKYQTDYPSFISALLMLSETVNGVRMSTMDFLLQNDEYQKWDHLLSERRSRYFSDQQEYETIHNSYAQERREQQAIQDGNLERFEQAINEPMTGYVGKINLESIRILKDLAIAVYTMSTRSAMDGGLNYEEGFSLSDIFIEQVERKQTPEELFQLLRFAQRDLVRRVDEAKKNSQKTEKKSTDHHPLIEEAKIYIDQHIRGDTSVSAIAAHLGVSENYLSRVFSRCTGKSLKQYILERKVDNARMLLTYSDYSCDEIAYYYGFSSGSHFGKMFRRFTGQTPAQYRLQNKVRTEK